jgi:hypothetical protein
MNGTAVVGTVAWAVPELDDLRAGAVSSLAFTLR